MTSRRRAKSTPFRSKKRKPLGPSRPKSAWLAGVLAHKLYRVITIWQVLWFTISECTRFAYGYTVTAMEFTTLTFSFMMFLASLFWYHKPSILSPLLIPTKDDRTIAQIRDLAQQTVSKMLDHCPFRYTHFIVFMFKRVLRLLLIIASPSRLTQTYPPTGIVPLYTSYQDPSFTPKSRGLTIPN